MPGTPFTVAGDEFVRMGTRIELVRSDSRQQAESAANNRIEEYEADGFELADQELDVEGSSVTMLLVFETPDDE